MDGLTLNAVSTLSPAKIHSHLAALQLLIAFRSAVEVQPVAPAAEGPPLTIKLTRPAMSIGRR